MRNLAVGGAAASLAAVANAHAQNLGISNGDAAILRFLAAAELLEQDLWQQYTELAQDNPAFKSALENIDTDMPTYVQQNTNDELAHEEFLNAFLIASGREPVDLDAFRTLPSSQATGALDTGRLTNLMHLNVDTSYYLRYRSSMNPDFGATFPQLFHIVDRPGIPLHDGYTQGQIQAIANTAAFHFGMIEQGGTSLYPELSLKASSLVTLRIVTNIGPTEAMHFLLWNEKAGGVPAADSGDGLVFVPPPAPAKIFPTPCAFLGQGFPANSVVRPTSPHLNGPTAVVNFLAKTGLFHGQSDGFFQVLNGLAAAAEAASRQF
jgi:hypothetical protein